MPLKTVHGELWHIAVVFFNLIFNAVSITNKNIYSTPLYWVCNRNLKRQTSQTPWTDQTGTICMSKNHQRKVKMCCFVIFFFFLHVYVFFLNSINVGHVVVILCVEGSPAKLFSSTIPCLWRCHLMTFLPLMCSLSALPLFFLLSFPLLCCPFICHTAAHPCTFPALTECWVDDQLYEMTEIQVKSQQRANRGLTFYTSQGL